MRTKTSELCSKRQERGKVARPCTRPRIEKKENEGWMQSRGDEESLLLVESKERVVRGKREIWRGP